MKYIGITLEAVGSLVDKKIKDVEKTYRKELSDFAAFIVRQISGDIESAKSKILGDLENRLPAIEEKLCKSVDAKVATIVEDVLLRGSFSFIPSGSFDSLVGPEITIITDVPSTSTSEVTTPNTQEPPAKRKCALTPADPAEPKKSVQKKYSWKKDNPRGEEFIIEKCAAVQYRRAQHIKELIYDQGVKEHIWEDSDNMFLKVSMRVDNVCKNAQ